MNRLIFKKHLLAIALLLLCGVSAQAADDDLITQQITIKLDKAGTLPNKIGSSKKYKITNLKIVGEINGTDLLLIRDMSGSNYRGFRTSGNLVFLDLSDAKIVSGGDYYYYLNQSFYTGYYYTAKDELGDFAFYECSKLKNIIIPSNVTSIGESAFQGCSGLTNLNIPSRVTAISVGAFQGCSGLTNLNIPSSVTTIGSGAFDGCSGLTSLNIPSITTISSYAFYGCSGLTSLIIPSSITTIGDYAFYGCSGLTSLNIPSTVTYIGNDAFIICFIYIFPFSSKNSNEKTQNKELDKPQNLIIAIYQGRYNTRNDLFRYYTNYTSKKDTFIDLLNVICEVCIESINNQDLSQIIKDRCQKVYSIVKPILEEEKEVEYLMNVTGKERDSLMFLHNSSKKLDVSKQEAVIRHLSIIADSIIITKNKLTEENNRNTQSLTLSMIGIILTILFSLLSLLSAENFSALHIYMDYIK